MSHVNGQTLVVALAIIAAACYLVYRGWEFQRRMRDSDSGKCASQSSCGQCAPRSGRCAPDESFIPVDQLMDR